MDSDADMQERLAFAIRAAMLAKGWKAPDLARAIGRDPSTVARWVSGQSIPNLLMTKQLAEALNVSPRLLYDPPPVPSYPLEEYLIPKADAERAADLARAAIELEREDLEQEAGARRAAAGSAAARRGKRPA